MQTSSCVGILLRFVIVIVGSIAMIFSIWVSSPTLHISEGDDIFTGIKNAISFSTLRMSAGAYPRTAIKNVTSPTSRMSAGYDIRTAIKNATSSTLRMSAGDDLRTAVKNATQGLRLPRKEELRLPELVFEVGAPRTATTTQFVHICVAMFLAYEGQGTSGRCSAEKTKQTLVQRIQAGGDFKHHWLIIKMHKIGHLIEYLSKPMEHIWIFTTATDFNEYFQKDVLQNTTNVHTERGQLPHRYAIFEKDTPHIDVYFRTMSDLKEMSVSNLTSAYANIFGLAPFQLDWFHEYMDLWNILRQCCGTQMSKHWRDVLQGRSKSYPPCDGRNLTQVERALVSTHVFRKFGSDPFISSLSDRDGHLTGDYCEKVKRFLRKNPGVGFNYNFKRFR